MGVEKTMGKKVRINLDRLINERNISIRELARRADIRPATLNELTNQKRLNINFGHIERIAESLNLDDIRQIIDLEETDD
jgi:putative transcriptional regulator